MGSGPSLYHLVFPNVLINYLFFPFDLLSFECHYDILTIAFSVFDHKTTRTTNLLSMIVMAPDRPIG